MQNNQFPYFSDEMGDRNMNVMYASASSFDALFPPCAKLPFHGVELHPYVVCQKNFVIFDQTYDRSQVMYHPELTPRLMNSGLASTFHNEYVGESYGQKVSTSHQEDPNVIDALLSTDEDSKMMMMRMRMVVIQKRSVGHLVTPPGNMEMHQLNHVALAMDLIVQEGSKFYWGVLVATMRGKERER